MPATVALTWLLYIGSICKLGKRAPGLALIRKGDHFASDALATCSSLATISGQP